MHSRRTPNDNAMSVLVVAVVVVVIVVTLGWNELKFIKVGDIDAPNLSASILDSSRLRMCSIVKSNVNNVVSINWTWIKR